MKVLVVEDEKKIASFIRKGLEPRGFTVEVAHDGEDGTTRALARPHDAVVLDIMLEGVMRVHGGTLKLNESRPGRTCCRLALPDHCPSPPPDGKHQRPRP